MNVKEKKVRNKLSRIFNRPDTQMGCIILVIICWFTWASCIGLMNSNESGNVDNTNIVEESYVIATTTSTEPATEGTTSISATSSTTSNTQTTTSTIISTTKSMVETETVTAEIDIYEEPTIIEEPVEIVTEEYVEVYEEPQVEEPETPIEEEIVYEENTYVEDEVYEDQSSSEVLLGTYEATWYTAVDMGYTSTPYGASGRYLETNYSIASNSIPQGSIVRIEGGGIDGVYRVDDRGGMADNVIDMYYWDRGCVPSSFLNAGRVDIQVYLLQ